MAIFLSSCLLHRRGSFSVSGSQFSSINKFGFGFSGHLSSLGLQEGKMSHLGSFVFRYNCIHPEKEVQTVSKPEDRIANEACSEVATVDEASTYEKPSLGIGKTERLVTKHKPNLNLPRPQISLFKRLILRLDESVDDLSKFAAPRKKGDMRDVMLMSISFAVYVYISQKIVCAYCIWHAMSKP